MGFTLPQKRYRLHFKDPDFEGFEVVCRSASMAEFIELSDLIDAEGVEAAERVFRLFTEGDPTHEPPRKAIIIEWNLQDEDGSSVDINYDGLMLLPPGVVWDLILSWMDAVAKIQAPLDRPSNDGEPHLEASLPMEVSIPSQPS